MTERERLPLEVRRDRYVEYLTQASEFIRRAVADGSPFFIYFNHSLKHMPVIPREEFKGKSRQGDWARKSARAREPFRGTARAPRRAWDRRQNNRVFAGDSRPEDVVLCRGTLGYWEGSYFAGGESNLRTPCIVRWPGHVAEDRVSDQIMHVTDWFATILHAAGLSEPTDWVIDGVNKLEWLAGSQDASAREGCIFWTAPGCTASSGAPLAGPGRAEMLERPVGGLSAPRIIKLVTRSTGTRRRRRPVPALLDRVSFQPDHQRVQSEHPARTSDPARGAARLHPGRQRPLTGTIADQLAPRWSCRRGRSRGKSPADGRRTLTE